MGSVSDRNYSWKDYGFKERLRTFTMITVLSFLILFLVSVAVRIVYEIRDSIAASVTSFVSETADVMVTEVHGRMKKIETLLDNLASEVDFLSDEEVHGILSNVSYVSSNRGYIVMKNDGSWISNEPVSSYIPELRLRLINDTDSILFLSDGSSFVYFPLKSGRGIIGCLKDPAQTASFLIPSGTGQKGNVICDLSGNVLVSDTSPEEIYSSSLYSLNGEKIDRVLNSVAKGESGTMFLRHPDGDIAVTMNRLEDYDFVFVSAFFVSMVNQSQGSAFTALGLICALMVILFILLISTMMRSSRIRSVVMTQAAFFDPVTGGLNLSGLLYQAGRVPDGRTDHVLVLLSLRDYTINAASRETDTVNRLLKLTMESLLNHTAEDELVCRTYGEHFLLLLRSCAPDLLEKRIWMMAQTCENEFNRNMSEADKLSVSFATGVYALTKGEDIAAAAEKVRIVNDIAVQNDDGGTVFAYYDENLMRELQKEKEIADAFPYAMDSREFIVYYQPKIDSLTGRAEGAEALVRWNRNGKIITPSEFIPVFEKNGYIIDLDMYVLGEVCSQLRTAFAKGQNVVPVAVNLSRRHFAKNGVADEIEAIRKSSAIPASLIEIEITESIFLDRKTIQIVRDELEKLHDYGFCCALDDFGSGYSSLGLLTDFEIDCLKIDKSFMDGIFSEKTRMVVSSIINLASSLSIDVVAEGVETGEQLEILKELGGRTVQGFVYSKPLPYPEWRAWLDRFGGGRTYPAPEVKR